MCTYINLFSCTFDIKSHIEVIVIFFSFIPRDFIIISTIDGIITALDIKTGKKCWTVLLDAEKFLSSTLSELEVIKFNFFLIKSIIAIFGITVIYSW